MQCSTKGKEREEEKEEKKRQVGTQIYTKKNRTTKEQKMGGVRWLLSDYNFVSGEAFNAGVFWY